MQELHPFHNGQVMQAPVGLYLFVKLGDRVMGREPFEQVGTRLQSRRTFPPGY